MRLFSENETSPRATGGRTDAPRDGDLALVLGARMTARARRPDVTARLASAASSSLPDAVRWSVQDLCKVGFSHRDAERLHALLPPVPLPTLTVALATAGPSPGEEAAVATILWATHDLSADMGRRLAATGQDVLDLIAMLDALLLAHPDAALWQPRMSDLVLEWADLFPLVGQRLPRYIAAGLDPDEADKLARAPSGPPTDEQLRLLAALRNTPPNDGQRTV